MFFVKVYTPFENWNDWREEKRSQYLAAHATRRKFGFQMIYDNDTPNSPYSRTACIGILGWNGNGAY